MKTAQECSCAINERKAQNQFHAKTSVTLKFLKAVADPGGNLRQMPPKRLRRPVEWRPVLEVIEVETHSFSLTQHSSLFFNA